MNFSAYFFAHCVFHLANCSHPPIQMGGVKIFTKPQCEHSSVATLLCIKHFYFTPEVKYIYGAVNEKFEKRYNTKYPYIFIENEFIGGCDQFKQRLSGDNSAKCNPEKDLEILLHSQDFKKFKL